MYKSLVQKMQIAEDEFLEFVLLFGRIEYALKRTTGLAFVKGGAVYANWTKFGRDLDSGFDPTQNDDLCHGIEYLMQQSPLKQILKDEELSFVQAKPRSDEPSLVQVLDAVKIVRNNLLHGGKFPDSEILDPARNRTLLKSGSAVLLKCLRLASESDKPELRNVFEVFVDGLDLPSLPEN